MFLLLVTIVLFVSCGEEEPVADFTWTPEISTAGQEVTFTNLTEEARSYSWDFGDSSTSSLANPVHTYTNPGEFTIELVASNRSKSDVATRTIMVIGR